MRHVIVALLVSAVVGASLASPAPEVKPAAAAGGFRTHFDQVYAKVGERELKLDLYLPPQVGDRKPALVVWIHGGGWRAGDKRPTPMVHLVPKGFAVASIAYRFSQEATFPAQAHDCKAAIRWLRANAGRFGYDAARIGAIGASAGGHLVMLLGTSGGVADLEGDLGDHDEQPSGIDAVVSLFGPSDLVDFEALGNQRQVADRLVEQLLGGPLAETKDKAKLASPVHHVGPGDAPLMLLHGERDMLVPIAQSERIHAAYQKAALDSTLHRIAGAGHGGGQFATPQMREAVETFFRKHLSPP